MEQRKLSDQANTLVDLSKVSQVKCQNELQRYTRARTDHFPRFCTDLHTCVALCLLATKQNKC